MKQAFFLFLLPLLLAGCRKEKDIFDGPSLEDLNKSFALLQPFECNKDSVAFGIGETAIFSAKFNKTVQWHIDIRGTESRAHKVISGQGNEIKAAEATWNGSTTFFPMFRNEACLATLHVNGVNDSFTVPVKIRSVKKNGGLLISEFESGLPSAWTRFVQSGANMELAAKTDSLAPQGKSYLSMAGTVSWDWLTVMLDFPATAYGASTLPLNTNPDAVYFNCLIYGVPGTNPSLVLFQFKEDENADGVINGNTEDQYDLQVNVNWSGWKLVSIKYADIPSLSNGQPATPKGNSKHNPDKIGKISVLHLADPKGGFAAAKVDYILFTDIPLQP
jgi:hypothetical protein